MNANEQPHKDADKCPVCEAPVLVAERDGKTACSNPKCKFAKGFSDPTTIREMNEAIARACHWPVGAHVLCEECGARITYDCVNPDSFHEGCGGIVVGEDALDFFTDPRACAEANKVLRLGVRCITEQVCGWRVELNIFARQHLYACGLGETLAAAWARAIFQTPTVQAQYERMKG